MGKGERGGGRMLEVKEVSKVQKYTSVIQCCSGEIFFRAKNFFVDDDNGLSATGSVR